MVATLTGGNRHPIYVRDSYPHFVTCYKINRPYSSEERFGAENMISEFSRAWIFPTKLQLPSHTAGINISNAQCPAL